MKNETYSVVVAFTLPSGIRDSASFAVRTNHTAKARRQGLEMAECAYLLSTGFKVVSVTRK